MSNWGYPDYEFDAGDSYDWSAVGVWVKGGRYYLDTDGGCSCNDPWEWPAEPTGPLTYKQMKQEVKALTNPDTGYMNYDRADVKALLREIKDKEER